MKTERRQELKQNELSDILARWIAVVQPYSRIIVGVVIAVCVVVGLATWFEYQSRSSVEKAWADYFNEGLNIDARSGQPDADFDVLSRLAGEQADEPVGQWALVSSADLRLARGVRLLLQIGSWDMGQKELDSAIQDYTNVLKALDEADEPIRDDLLRQQATYGLARAHESRNGLDEAKKQYEKLVDRWPDGPYTSHARKQLETIDTWAAQLYAGLKNTVANQVNPLGGLDSRSNGAKEDAKPKLPDFLKLFDPSDNEHSGLKDLLTPSDSSPKEKPAKDDPATPQPKQTVPASTTPPGTGKPDTNKPDTNNPDASKPDGAAKPPASKESVPAAPK